ncbi:hypothetical protein [Leifsonia sp. 1010]|uniref:DUF7507 domain-containing protein n=1 Tax=Leifsonia sp. 1010 TaxID=2817769 RepID=UPI00285FEFFE|nr:hypothetical protein [Leifsonia sp. 1010]MDR6613720.1 putative repeat protein (TIGR01451 family) [Leifsonia sp. 1010]
MATIAILSLTVAGISVGIQAPPAGATTAGTPGTPQPPTALFTEDFSGQNAASTAIKITSYQGTPGSTYVPGVSGANSETYYADPRWADGLYCNGYIVNGSTTPAPPGWNSGCPISGVQILANAMGQYQGYSTAAAAQNQAVTAYTASGTVPGIQLRTNTAIPAVPGHFYQVTSIVAATNCVANSSGNPAETLSLFINGVKNVLASQLDPCHYPGAIQYGSGPFGPTMVAGLTSAAIKVPSTGTPTVGMQLENQSAVVAGNDGAFDLPQILDVTPQLDKAFSPATIASGQTSTLTFTITNTSELAAKNGWSFHDDLPAGVTATGVNATTCSSGTVTAAAGSTSVVVANGNLTQGQNACTVTVQVTATVPGTYTNGPGNFPDGTAGLDGLNPPADTPLTVTPPASLIVTKASSTTAITRVGQVVTYKFVVTNRSQVTLNNISVVDAQTPPASQANLSAILCETQTLAPQASTTCTARYTVTQADLDNGSVRDTATASGLDPGGATVTAPPATLTITSARPAISVVKSTTTTLASAVGQKIPYRFLVTNTGNVTLAGITVDDQVAAPSDPANLSAIDCPATTLAPTATTTCTATYTVTQADVDNGSVADSATASGTPPATPTDPTPPTVDSPVSTVTITVTDQPALTVTKSSPQSATPPTVAGALITYDFLVRNTGNVTLTDIQVDDIQDAPASQSSLSPVTCPPGALAPGAQVTCTATYTVTQADVDHGSITDRATASGLPPSTPADPTPPRVGSPESTLSIPSPATPSLTVTKSSTTTAVTQVGQRVPYEFLVTNTGTSTLTAVTVADQVTAPSDPTNLSAVDCPQDTLVPAQTMTCTATYTVTQADVDNGSVSDTATASGTPPATPADPNPPTVTSPDSTVTITVDQTPGLSVQKSTTATAVTRAGQQVAYTFLVTNTGNVALTAVTVADQVAAPSDPANLSAVDCPQSTLAPAQTMTCSATYTVTQADVDNGSVTDTATATGTPPATPTDPNPSPIASPPSTVTLAATPAPGLTVDKTTETGVVTMAGQQVVFQFAVRNTGNVTLDGIVVTDTVAAPSDQANLSRVSCPTAVLAPGERMTCTATYTVTAADMMLATSISDTAVATGIGPDGGRVGSPESTLALPVRAIAHLPIVTG